MTPQNVPYGNITWVLCVPDPETPNRIVPFLHRKRGAVWFSEPQYLDRFIRENPALPHGSRSRAVVGIDRLIALAVQLLNAGVDTVYTDLEHGKDAPGESLAALVRRLRGTPAPSVDASSGRARLPGVRKPC